MAGLITPKNKYGINALLVRGYAEIHSQGGRFTANPLHPYQAFHSSLDRISWTMEKIAKIGFGWVRDWFSTPTIESTIAYGGTWNPANTNPAGSVNMTTPYNAAALTDWEAMDLLIDLARQYGIAVSLTMPFLNASGWGEGEYDAGNYANWRDNLHGPVVDAFLARYSDCDDVLVLDPYNEAFGVFYSTPNNRADLAINFYDRVKAVSPNMTVALGGQFDSGWVNTLLDRLNVLGRKDAFDMVALHCYPTGDASNTINGEIASIKAKLTAIGRSGAPILIQEFGGGVDPETGGPSGIDQDGCLRDGYPAINADAQVKAGMFWQAWGLQGDWDQNGTLSDPPFFYEGGVGFPWSIGQWTYDTEAAANGLWLADSSPAGTETSILPGTFRDLIPVGDRAVDNPFSWATKTPRAGWSRVAGGYVQYAWPITVSPGAAYCRAAGTEPAVIRGALVLTPAPASAVAASANPAVVSGYVLLTPAAAWARAAGADPIFLPESIVLSPVPAWARAIGSDPRVQLSPLQQKLAARTPVELIIITLDYCTRTFGVAPCLGTGTPCYNTWGTCKYKQAFDKTTKDYRFTSNAAPIVFDDARPYVSRVSTKPTEIKTSMTVSGQVDVELLDEPDEDVGIDPYWSSRTSHPGTYFKKLIARNPNYRGRPLRRLEGFAGEDESGYIETWRGGLDNVTISGNRVRFTAKDMLRDLAKIEVPAKSKIKLAIDLEAEQTSALTLNSVDGLAASGYVRIDEEIIGYASVDAETRQIKTLTRACYGTVADDHGENGKVQQCRIYGPANPWDILKNEMLQTDAGIAAADIDATAFAFWRDWPAPDVNFFAVISEPTKLSDLVGEIRDLLDMKMWIGEDLKITVRRNVPNEPGRTYATLSDADNIRIFAGGVDLNEKERITRCAIYWGKAAIGDMNDPGAYNRLEVAIDGDAESENGYDERAEKKMWCRWISTDYLQEEYAEQYVRSLAMRTVLQHREGQPIIDVEVDLKDRTVKTGHYVQLTTDELLQADGTPLPGLKYQVIRREMKGARIGYRLLRMSQRRYAIIAPGGHPGYASATEAQREYGFIAGTDGNMSNGDPGYHPY